MPISIEQMEAELKAAGWGQIKGETTWWMKDGLPGQCMTATAWAVQQAIDRRSAEDAAKSDQSAIIADLEKKLSYALEMHRQAVDEKVKMRSEVLKLQEKLQQISEIASEFKL